MQKNTNEAKADNKYAPVSQKKQLKTGTLKKVVGGIHCRKAGGTQQE